MTNTVVKPGRPHVPETELHAYLDAQLSPAQRTEVSEHLLSCLICRAAHADAEDTRARVAALLAIASPRVIRGPRIAEPVRRSYRSMVAAASVVIVGAGAWAALRGGDLPTATPRVVDVAALATPMFPIAPDNLPAGFAAPASAQRTALGSRLTLRTHGDRVIVSEAVPACRVEPPRASPVGCAE